MVPPREGCRVFFCHIIGKERGGGTEHLGGPPSCPKRWPQKRGAAFWAPGSSVGRAMGTQGERGVTITAPAFGHGAASLPFPSWLFFSGLGFFPHQAHPKRLALAWRKGSPEPAVSVRRHKPGYLRPRDADPGAPAALFWWWNRKKKTHFGFSSVLFPRLGLGKVVTGRGASAFFGFWSVKIPSEAGVASLGAGPRAPAAVPL